jgi:hypothetical protein
MICDSGEGLEGCFNLLIVKLDMLLKKIMRIVALFQQE